MVKNIFIFPLGGGKPTQILTNGEVKPMAKILQSCPLNQSHSFGYISPVGNSKVPWQESILRPPRNELSSMVIRQKRSSRGRWGSQVLLDHRSIVAEKWVSFVSFSLTDM